MKIHEEASLSSQVFHMSLFFRSSDAWKLTDEIIVPETVKNTSHTKHLTLLTKNNSAQLGVFIYKEFQYKVNMVNEFPFFPWRGHVQGSLAMQDGKAWPVPTC